MKRTLIVVLALTTCLFTTQAFAGLMADTYFDDATPYLTLGGGVSKMKGTGITDPSGATRVSVLPGYNAMLATGLAWDVGRVELSASYVYENLDQLNIGGSWADTEGNITMFNLMASVFYDFNKDGMMSPYFGVGVGGARLDLDSDVLAGNDAFTFAYQLGAGLTLNTSDSFVIDLGYKLLGTNSVDFGETKADFIMFQNVNLGFRFLF